MLREACPRCGRPLGWGGPRVDDRLARRQLGGPVLWHCQHCGVQLHPVSSRAQNGARLAMSLGLLVLSLGALTRFFWLPPAWLRPVVLVASVAALVGSAATLYFLLTRPQWKVLDACAPAPTPVPPTP